MTRCPGVLLCLLIAAASVAAQDASNAERDALAAEFPPYDKPVSDQ